ncbi:hypothetical protein [Limimaricola hongkongensis]|uniref:Uncharacterized protein n=1 Tax=Limimaricola hongkongensis DSM 17492 TaxID=1122180 RepID=A0A017HDI9_9RHOB|nr:hypothetical protein [Limimaricola hongkongensis]EYD72431.1 hypothetical protein Lokhon_01230 [Limimaricola hongkongensis DSM 17492]
MKSLVLAAALAMLAPPALAQEVITSYAAWLSPNDMVNSRGVRLSGIGAILQQDRANFHRFGRRDEGDGGDGLFASRDMRARIPDLYARGPGAPAYILDDIRSGRGHYVWVRVIGRAGRPDYIEVHEGAG